MSAGQNPGTVYDSGRASKKLRKFGEASSGCFGSPGSKESPNRAVVRAPTRTTAHLTWFGGGRISGFKTALPVMKTKLSLTLVLLLAGCATPSQKVEHGPQGTIAYNVEIEASDVGARVEANGDYVGKTPMTLKIFGDKEGTFHNFGSQEYVIQVFPVKTNQFVQTKLFRTGGWFSQEDRVPSRLFFDLNQKSEGFSVGPKY